MTITKQDIKNSVAIHGMGEGIKRALDGGDISGILDLAIGMVEDVKDSFNRMFDQAYKLETLRVIAKAKAIK